MLMILQKYVKRSVPLKEKNLQRAKIVLQSAWSAKTMLTAQFAKRVFFYTRTFAMMNVLREAILLTLKKSAKTVMFLVKTVWALAKTIAKMIARR
jgi:hypothetical protein